MEFLIKSDFNSFTCLLIGNLFDHCYTDNVSKAQKCLEIYLTLKSDIEIEWKYRRKKWS